MTPQTPLRQPLRPVGHPRVGPSAWLRRRSGALSLVLLALATLISVGTLPWTTRWYDVQPLSAIRCAPSLRPCAPADPFAADAPDAPGLATDLLYAASSWMGHDNLGRSVLFRLLPGFLISLGIGLAGAAVAVVIGVAWGATAAMLGGRTDRLMMQVVDVLYGLPYILTVVLLKTALTPPLTALFAGQSKTAGVVILLLAIGGVSWLTMARVVRGQVLSLRSRTFVEAARAAGAGPVFILRRHLIPNMVGPILAYAALVVPQAMMQEAFLSFLGIGVPPPLPSLGRLAADGVEAVNTFVGYWWLIVFPCAALFLTLLLLNILADSSPTTDARHTRTQP